MLKNFFTANKLKILAILLMLLDHVIAVFIPITSPELILLRMPGRIVAPIMCFFIAEGYHYSKNRKRYLSRLILFGVISHIPFVLAIGYGLFEKTNIMFTLALGLIALISLKNKNLHLIFKLFITFICILLSIFCDWGYIVVLWIICFGLLQENGRRAQILGFIAISIFAFLLPTYLPIAQIPGAIYYLICYSGIFLLIPLLLLYNGKLGKKSKIISLGFYIFYPLHLSIIYLLTLVI